MKQYSTQEILDLLQVTGGNEEDQAAAAAVVASAIKESRRLGRIAVGTPRSSWHRNNATLRGHLAPHWSDSSKPGLE